MDIKVFHFLSNDKSLSWYKHGNNNDQASLARHASEAKTWVGNFREIPNTRPEWTTGKFLIQDKQNPSSVSNPHEAKSILILDE